MDDAQKHNKQSPNNSPKDTAKSGFGTASNGVKRSGGFGKSGFEKNWSGGFSEHRKNPDTGNYIPTPLEKLYRGR